MRCEGEINKEDERYRKTDGERGLALTLTLTLRKKRKAKERDTMGGLQYTVCVSV